jgi:hypothetical protein
MNRLGINTSIDNTEHKYLDEDPEVDVPFTQWYVGTWITVNGVSAPACTHLIMTTDDCLKLDILTRAYRAGYAEGKRKL